MTPEIRRIARALGFADTDDATLKDIVERATFIHQFCVARYKANACSGDDLDAARLGLSDEAVGRVLEGLNRDAARHATTEPGDPPIESDDEPFPLPPMGAPRVPTFPIEDS